VTGLAGRAALVTGGGSGIGRAVCAALAADGARVAIGYGEDEEAAEQCAADLRAAGGEAVVLHADLADAAAAEALADAATDALGPLDVLVANAGIAPPATVPQVDAEAWDALMAVNLRAPYLLARRVLPGMRARRFGRIVFITSVAGFTGGVVGPHYAASKAALHGLTHYLASRVAADGVTVNAVAPALIADTGMLPGPAGELARRIPVGRLGRPEEVADLVTAVVRNAYLTNQVLSVDGGLHPR
jgi:3-oxoacyl-[acyl-carrier protein] reductase